MERAGFVYIPEIPKQLPALAATATDGESATGNAIGADVNGNPRPALATQEWIRG
jgi:hypothetical protein